MTKDEARAALSDLDHWEGEVVRLEVAKAQLERGILEARNRLAKAHEVIRQALTALEPK